MSDFWKNYYNGKYSVGGKRKEAEIETEVSFWDKYYGGGFSVGPDRNVAKDDDELKKATRRDYKLPASLSGDREYESAMKQKQYDEYLGTLRSSVDIQRDLNAVGDALKIERDKRRADVRSQLQNGNDITLASGKPQANAELDSRISMLQSRYDALEKELKENTYANYERNRLENDFAENSKYRSTDTGAAHARMDLFGDTLITGYGNWKNEIINRNPDALAALNERTAGAGLATGASIDLPSLTGNDYSWTQYMTDDQISMYNYIANTKGAEEADKYLDYIRSDVYAADRARNEAEARAYAEEHPVKASAKTVLQAPLKGISYIGQAADYLADGRIEANAPYNRYSYEPTAMRGAVQQQVEDRWGVVGSFLYGTGMSMADFLLTNAISGGAEWISLGLMGTGAAADTVLSAKERGLSDDQAFALGTVAGAAEILTEKVSVDRLFSAIRDRNGWVGKNIKEVILNLAGDTFAEGSEEAVSDVINCVADILAAGDQSEWNTAIRTYREQNPGMTESDAFKYAFVDKMKEIGLDFLGGALSGFLMGSGASLTNTAITAAQQNREKSQGIELARQARQETINPKEFEFIQDDEGGFTLPTAAEAMGGETNAGEIRTGSEKQFDGTLPTAEESELESRIDAAETETEKTGMRYGVDQKEIDSAKRLAQATGMEIRFFTQDAKNGTMDNGFYNPSTGEIQLNAKSKRKTAVTVAHELTHTFEGTESYAALQDYAKSDAVRKGRDWNAEREMIRSLYQRAGIELPGESDIDAEITAQWMERNFGSEKAITEICRDNPSLAKKIRDGLDTIVLKLADLSGRQTWYEAEEIRNVMATYDRMLKKYENDVQAKLETSRGAKTDTATDTTDTRAIQENAAERTTEGETAEEFYARMEDAHKAGEIDAELWEDAQAIYDEWTSVGNGESTTVADDGPEGRLPKWFREKKEALENAVTRKAAGRKIREEMPGEAVDRTETEEPASAAETQQATATPTMAQSTAQEAAQNRKAVLENENFRRWFRDSKVVNEDGSPKIMYHGTSNGGFEFFDTYGKSGYGLFGMGAYFTENPYVAETYTKKGKGKKPMIYPAYLAISNPIDMDAPADIEAWKKVMLQADERFMPGEIEGLDTNEDVYRAVEEQVEDFEVPKYEGAEIMQGLLEGMGYDGITHMGGGRVNADDPKHRVYIAFDGGQVKSAVGNNGEYSAEDPNIHHSISRVTAGNADEVLDENGVTPITEEEDQEYMNAVNSGDMETAQRMVDEAAEKAGYTVKVYHGTPNGTFNEFRDWQYFTPNKEYADVYQGQSASSNGYKPTANNPKTYSIYLNPQKIFDTRKPRERRIFKNEFFQKWGNGAPLSDRGLPDWTDGYDLVEFFDENSYDYDSFVLDEGGTGGYGDDVNDRGISYVVKTSNQLKLTDPVTYDDNGNVIPLSQRFNANNPDIRYSVSDDDTITQIKTAEYDEGSYQSVGMKYRIGGKDIAWVSMLVDDNSAYVERIDVDEAHRNQGIGTRILKSLAKQYNGIIVAPDNEDAARLYARIGYDYNDEMYDQGYGVYNIPDFGEETGIEIADDASEDPNIYHSVSDENETGPIYELPAKARSNALKVEDRLARRLDSALDLGLAGPNGGMTDTLKKFRTDSVRPIVEAFLRGEEPDTASLWSEYATDPLQQYAFDQAFEDALPALEQIRGFGERARSEKEARDARNAELDAQIPTEAADLVKLAESVKQAKRNLATVRGRLMLTEEDERTVRAILSGEMSESEAAASHQLSIEQILEAVNAEREARRAEAPWARYTQRMAAQRRADADKHLENAAGWKDKKAGWRYDRETAERNIRDITPDGETADALIRDYFRPVHTAEAKSTRFKNDYIRRVKGLDISMKVTGDNTASESYAVQYLGEAEDNIRYLQAMRSPKAVRDGHTLQEWQAEVEAFRADNPDMDWAKVNKGIQEFTKIYGELIQQMNGVLVENGYMPVNVRRGYFPHFNGGEDTVMARFQNLLGVKINTAALPTSINGLTAGFRPGKTWFGHALERTGFSTTYDAVQGFQNYIGGVSDVIHQTTNLRNLRALATQVRYRTSDEQIQNQIDEIMANDTLEEAERQTLVDALKQNGKYQLSNFVAWIDEYTNLLANKKSKFDRGVEDLAGRKFYNLMKNLEGRVAANMISGNLGSALTNFIPLNQASAMLGDRNVLRGMYQTLHGYASDDGFRDRSDFLVNRRGVDPLYQNTSQKVSEFLSTPMNVIDNFASESIVRAAYNRYRGEGMDSDEAMTAADEFAAGVMADRSKGAQPVIFGSHNPLLKLLTQFQVEVNNEWSTVLKDIPKDYKDKAVWILLRYFVGAYLFNDLYEKVVGRRAALDPIDLINDAVGGITGYQVPNTVDLVQDLIGSEEADWGSAEDREDPYVAITDTLSGAAEELPFVGGLLGGGRIPISSALPDKDKMLKALLSTSWAPKKRLFTAGQEIGKSIGTYVIPPFAGGFGKKIVETAVNTARGGRYTMDADGNDVLQYPYYTDEGAVGTVLKSALFGPTATEGGQDWIESGFKSLTAKQTSAYQGLINNGADQRGAYDVVQMPAKTRTDKLAKYRAAIDLGGSTAQKNNILGMLLDDSEANKFRAGKVYGDLDAETYVGWQEFLPRYDADGSGTFTQNEVITAIEDYAGQAGLTNAERAALYQLQNLGWTNNPYDEEVGKAIKAMLGK